MNEDKNLSGEEKRARLKEQYKREMRAQKEKLDSIRNAGVMRNLNEKLNRVMGGVLDKNDEYEEFMGKLDQETAMSEARVDMMLDEFREEVKREQGGENNAADNKQSSAGQKSDETLSASDKTLGDMTAPGSKPEKKDETPDKRRPGAARQQQPHLARLGTVSAPLLNFIRTAAQPVRVIDDF